MAVNDIDGNPLQPSKGPRVLTPSDTTLLQDIRGISVHGDGSVALIGGTLVLSSIHEDDFTFKVVNQGGDMWRPPYDCWWAKVKLTGTSLGVSDLVLGW